MQAVVVYLAPPEGLLRHYTLGRVHENSLEFEIHANEVRLIFQVGSFLTTDLEQLLRDC